MIGEGAPVVILHGMFGSGTNWRAIARRLAASARVYSVDLRNHGASPWADAMSYPEMAADVSRFIDAHGLARPALMGHSMGGKVAMALALTRPEQIGRLVVVDIAPVAYNDRMSMYVEAMRGVDMLHSTTRAEIRRVLGQSVPDAGIVGFLMQNLVDRGEHFDWRVNLGAIARAMPELCSFPTELAGLRFEGPSMALAGERSDYIRPPDASRFAPMFPGIDVDVIEGAGHWVHADRPEAFLLRARVGLGLPAPP